MELYCTFSYQRSLTSTGLPCLSGPFSLLQSAEDLLFIFLVWLTAGVSSSLTSAVFCSSSACSMFGWLSSSCFSAQNLRSHGIVVLFSSGSCNSGSQWVFQPIFNTSAVVQTLSACFGGEGTDLRNTPSSSCERHRQKKDGTEWESVLHWNENTQKESKRFNGMFLELLVCRLTVCLDFAGFAMTLWKACALQSSSQPWSSSFL